VTEVLFVTGPVIACFVGYNIGGATTGPAFGPAVGAGVVGKVTAAGLVSVCFFVVDRLPGHRLLGRRDGRPVSLPGHRTPCRHRQESRTPPRLRTLGTAAASGSGHLIFVGMNPLVAAFQGGLVLGYFLRSGRT